MAEKAFVRCVDYQGIQFVKRLRQFDDSNKQKAEVAAYFQRFDEADSIYRDIDRKDLAIELQVPSRRDARGIYLRAAQELQGPLTLGVRVRRAELPSGATDAARAPFAVRRTTPTTPTTPTPPTPPAPTLTPTPTPAPTPKPTPSTP